MYVEVTFITKTIAADLHRTLFFTEDALQSVKEDIMNCDAYERHPAPFSNIMSMNLLALQKWIKCTCLSLHPDHRTMARHSRLELISHAWKWMWWKPGRNGQQMLQLQSVFGRLLHPAGSRVREAWEFPHDCRIDAKHLENAWARGARVSEPSIWPSVKLKKGNTVWSRWCMAHAKRMLSSQVKVPRHWWRSRHDTDNSRSKSDAESLGRTLVAWRKPTGHVFDRPAAFRIDRKHWLRHDSS